MYLHPVQVVQAFTDYRACKSPILPFKSPCFPVFSSVFHAFQCIQCNLISIIFHNILLTFSGRTFNHFWISFLPQRT